MGRFKAGRRAIAGVAVIMAVFLGLIKVHAGVITTGCTNVNVSCTIQELLFQGGTITIDDIIFDTWTPLSLPVGPDLSQIEVRPLVDAFNPGLQFTANGQLTVRGIEGIEFRFNFRVAHIGGIPLIKDNSLALTAFALSGAGGIIEIDEVILDEDGNTLGNKSVFADQLLRDFQLFAAEEFPPQQSIIVDKDIFVAGDFVSDTISLEMFEQRFSQIPEPAAFTLFGVGLTSLGYMTWRRREAGK
jgi:hypothetical protein